MLSGPSKVRWVFVICLCAGLAGMLASRPDSFAARIKFGPLEVETDDKTPPEEEPAATEEAPAATEEAPVPPPELKSESPKPLDFGGGEGKIVYHAHLTDVVDLGIAPFLDRVLADAEEAGAAALVVEIDTPGGRVDAAVQIKDILLESRIPTIAFINKQAISAGALIALAHDYIVWSTGGTMGAATPIQMGGGGGAEPVEEKMVSYMRGVMSATAEAKGRDGFVATAMVDHTLNLPDYAPEGQLLTSTFTQAEALGLLDGKADSFEQLLEVCNLVGAEVIEPEVNWAEKIARFLTHPVVSSLLMTVGMLGILMELYSPGFGITGIIGLLSLLLFFGGHMIVHVAGLEEIALFLLGIVLLIVEVAVIPGFGIIGVAGALAIAVSMILALVGIRVDIAWASGILITALGQFSIAVVLTTVIMIFGVRFLPSVGPVRGLILTAALRKEEGFIATDPKISAALLGVEGVALTDLRPGGKARLDGKKVDVAAYGEFISRGEKVKVIEVDGPSVTVERFVDGGGEDAG